MAATMPNPNIIDPDDDGWCLYNAILAAFAPYRAAISAGQKARRSLLETTDTSEKSRIKAVDAPLKDKRARAARKFAFLLAKYANADAVLLERLRDSVPLVGEPILKPSGSDADRLGIVTQEIETDMGNEYVLVDGNRRRFVEGADAFLSALYDLRQDNPTVLGGPRVWGEYMLLYPILQKVLAKHGVGIRIREMDKVGSPVRSALFPENTNIDGKFITVLKIGNHFALLDPPEPAIEADPIRALEEIVFKDAANLAEAERKNIYTSDELRAMRTHDDVHSAATGLVNLIGNLANLVAPPPVVPTPPDVPTPPVVSTPPAVPTPPVVSTSPSEAPVQKNAATLADTLAKMPEPPTDTIEKLKTLATKKTIDPFVETQIKLLMSSMPPAPSGPVTPEVRDEIERLSEMLPSPVASTPVSEEEALAVVEEDALPPTPNAPTPNVPTPNVSTPNAPTPNIPTPNAAPTPNTPTPNAPTPVSEEEAPEPPAVSLPERPTPLNVSPPAVPPPPPRTPTQPDTPAPPPEKIAPWITRLVPDSNISSECLKSDVITPDCISKAARRSADIASQFADSQRVAQVRGTWDKYQADPLVAAATNEGPLEGQKLSRWLQLSNKYPDRTVKVRNPKTGMIEEFPVSNPYRASRYRERIIAAGGEASFANPSATAIGISEEEHPEEAAMWQQNAVLLNKVAPREMIADNKMAVSLLESLWFCGTSADVASDPRCFPARALGELREYQATKTQALRSALAKKALEDSRDTWKSLKQSVRRITGMIETPLTPEEIEAAQAQVQEPTPTSTPPDIPEVPRDIEQLRQLMNYRVNNLQTRIEALRHELEMRGSAPPPGPSPVVAPPMAPVVLRSTASTEAISSPAPSEMNVSPSSSVETLAGSVRDLPIRGGISVPTRFGPPKEMRRHEGITSRIPAIMSGAVRT